MLTFYSAILFDMLFWHSIPYLASILPFYLTLYSGLLFGFLSIWHAIVAFYTVSGINSAILFDTLFWHSIWRSILYMAFILPFYSAILSDMLFWHSILYLASILPFYLTLYSGILFGVLYCIWHLFWHSILPFYLTCYCGILYCIWHQFCHSIWHSILAFIWRSILYMAFILTFYSAILSDILFWHCIGHSIWHLFWRSLWHEHCRTSAPTEIWSPLLRSSSAHWHLELAVDVRRCRLRSGARKIRGCRRRKKKMEKEEATEATLIKSRI